MQEWPAPIMAKDEPLGAGNSLPCARGTGLRQKIWFVIFAVERAVIGYLPRCSIRAACASPGLCGQG